MHHEAGKQVRCHVVGFSKRAALRNAIAEVGEGYGEATVVRISIKDGRVLKHGNAYSFVKPSSLSMVYMVFVFNSVAGWRGRYVALPPSMTFVCFFRSSNMQPCFLSHRFNSPHVTLQEYTNSSTLGKATLTRSCSGLGFLGGQSTGMPARRKL